jgi:methionyl-tRNA formyltransferase
LIKIFNAKPSNEVLSAGEIIMDKKMGIHIGLKNGSIEVTLLQTEGKRVMSAKEFLAGYRN